MAWPASARSRDTRLLALVAAFWAASLCLLTPTKRVKNEKRYSPPIRAEQHLIFPFLYVSTVRT